MSDAALLVAPCSHKAAAFATKNWHYSRKLPVGKIVSFGVWEHGTFIGAVSFGQGASPTLGRAYGLTGMEAVELVRVALTDHEAPVSQIVPQAIAQLKQRSTGLRMLLSFADTAQGHTGSIYQAMNWIYLGETNTAKQYVDRHGQKFHPRSVAKDGVVLMYNKRKPVPKYVEMATIVETPIKHRYGLPLDKAIRRVVAPMALPYPAAS